MDVTDVTFAGVVLGCGVVILMEKEQKTTIGKCQKVR